MTIYAGPGIDGKEVVTYELEPKRVFSLDTDYAYPSFGARRPPKMEVNPIPAHDEYAVARDPMCICSSHMNDLSRPDGHLDNCPRGQAMRAAGLPTHRDIQPFGIPFPVYPPFDKYAAASSDKNWSPQDQHLLRPCKIVKDGAD